MSTSGVSICSNALLLLGAQTINDFDEETDRAILASNLYPQIRDWLLRKHTWNCAVKRVVLAPDVDAPAFDYAYQFSKPADWLRTLQVGEYGSEVDYKTEGSKFLCDDSIFRLRYVFRNEVEATWEPAMVHVATLAMKAAMAYPITKSASMTELAIQEFKDEFREVRAIDGQDDPPETLGDFPLLQARFSGSYFKW